MKKAIICLALGLLSIGGFAAPKDKTPKTIKCAVTGDTLNIADAMKKHMYADYKGRRYFFCCPGCPEQFSKSPAKFAKSPSIPTPKASKKK